MRTVRETVTFREGANLNLVVGLERFSNLNGVGVKAGIVAGHSKNYPDGTDIVMVATVNERGSSKIPSRPWIELAFQRNLPVMQKQMEDAAENILLGRTTAGRAMALIGQQLVATQRQSLQQLVTPPLSPATIKTKAANRASGRKATPPGRYHHPVEKPLIETAHLIQEHVWVVEGT